VSENPKDISKEASRVYVFGGMDYTIVAPVTLWVGSSSHRVLDASGDVHLVPFPAWNNRPVILRWTPKDVADPVQF
jgi:hypothetical protein